MYVINEINFDILTLTNITNPFVKLQKKLQKRTMKEKKI